MPSPTGIRSLQFAAAAAFLGSKAIAAPSAAPTFATAPVASNAVVHLAPAFRALPPDAVPRPPRPGLRLESHAYPGEGAVEWQLRLRAPEGETSPTVETPASADFTAVFPTSDPVQLHWSRGSHDAAHDFEPRTDTLVPGSPQRVASFGGRSSDGALPYFNLAGRGGGLILALGWTGNWEATFDLAAEGRVRIRAGLPPGRLRLPPGEEVRLPSVLLLPYAGDWWAGQNRFRRLMLAHFTPPSPAPLQLMPVAASVHGMIGFNDTTETNLVELARNLAELKLPLDTFWLDAGWNPGGFPRGQGNPEPDPRRFPNGLAPVGRAAAAAGLRFLVWFEPERVMRDTAIARDHPDWLLAPAHTPPDLRYQENDGFRLFDFGNPTARRWITDHVSRQITDARIQVYRQDCNLYPAWFWSGSGGPSQAALREIQHVSGMYAYLEELTRRHSGLVLDNCASGGRRLDFEMMRRSVALWRSDSCWGTRDFPRSVQAMTYGLSLWLPLHGLGAAATDDVALRSGMGACASFAINYRDPVAVAALRRHLDRYLPLRDLFLRDFHPLTDWSLSPTNVLAFEFHDPASGRALVQAFRSSSTVPFPDHLPVQGLDSDSVYEITDWDQTETSRRTGAELRSPGLPLGNAISAPARVVVLRRLPKP